MRAALYARFSTDEQSATSAEDQLAHCRRYAEQIGAHVVREFSDEGISGFSTGNRPGVRAMLAAAAERQFDVVIAEHTDRLSRGLSGSGSIYEDLRYFGVRYVTVNQGEVTAMHAGLSGMVSAMTLEEGAKKTRRGLKARVEAGKSGGGLTYGYRKKLAYDEAGEPRRGLLEIDDAQAAIVRRIFRDYAAGVSPLAIAAQLNREGVPGPRGGPWGPSTIHGNAKRGVGVLHNELYAGVRVWGRRTFVKNRLTGSRRGLDAAEPAVRVEVPELRIVEPALWQAARDRHQVQSTGPNGAGAFGHNRPKRVLQGLIVCACCGKGMQRAGPRDALRCATRVRKGDCPNNKIPGYGAIEARVFEAIRTNLLRPEAIELAIREIQSGLNAARRDGAVRRVKLQARLDEVLRRQGRLIEEMEKGAPWSAIAARHGQLDHERVTLEESLAAEAAGANDDAPAFHPAAPTLWRQHIEQLTAAMENPEILEDHAAVEGVRALIHQVRFTPKDGHGQYDLEIVGDLAPILMLGKEKGPAEAGPCLTLHSYQSMRGLGAGTRVDRRHTQGLAPYRQVA